MESSRQLCVRLCKFSVKNRFHVGLCKFCCRFRSSLLSFLFVADVCKVFDRFTHGRRKERNPAPAPHIQELACSDYLLVVSLEFLRFCEHVLVVVCFSLDFFVFPLFLLVVPRPNFFALTWFGQPEGCPL